MTEAFFHSGQFQQLTKRMFAIRRGYIVALSILAILSFANYAIIEMMLRSQSRSIALTEIASQQLANFRRVEHIVNLILHSIKQGANSARLVSQTQEELKLLRQSIAQNQKRLEYDITNESALLIDNKVLLQIIADPPYDLSKRTKIFLTNLDELSSLSHDVLLSRFSLWAQIELELASTGSLMTGTHKLSETLFQQSEKMSQKFNIAHVSIIIITLLTLLGEALFIFRPLLKRLAQAQRRTHVAFEKLRYYATVDQLTGLGNRHSFKLKLEEQENAGQLQHCYIALIDLDDFKIINDVIGHVAGDHVLKVTGERIQKSILDGDYAFRIGGDEFAIIRQTETDNISMRLAVQMLSSAINQPIPFGHETLFVGSSIGIATPAVTHAKTISTLLTQADLALRRAKKSGGNNISAYEQADIHANASAQILAKEIKEAFNDDSIIPYYQPIICIDSGDIIGVEALSHWLRKDNQITNPQEFLSTIEEFGMQTLLTEKLLGHIGRDREKCLKNNFNPGFFSINLSENALIDQRLPDHMSQCLCSKRLDWLQVEITETVLLHRSANAIERNLRRLMQLGISITLDNFGKGKTSINHVDGLLCSSIKIDRSLTAGIDKRQHDEHVIRSIIDISLDLGLKIVAEGIETQRQKDFFSSWRGLHGQGNLFGQAQTIDDVIHKFGNRQSPQGAAHSC